VILPGAEVERPAAAAGEPVRLLFSAGEERAALRLFLRALRTLPAESAWRATVWSPRPLTPPATLSRALRERLEFVDADHMPEAQALSRADVLVLASEGIRPVPGTLVRALAAGVLPIASRLGAYEELLGQGEYGFEFEPGDAQTLAAHLTRAIEEPTHREHARARQEELSARFSWTRVADDLEQVYDGLVARRHDTLGNGAVRTRLRERRMIDVDLHMHTDHSYDCATPVEVLLAEARSQGLGAIAVTDHNEISGAHAARAKADGLTVIVGEEVKTAEQGEVIGLFIEEKIPRGMTLQETIDEIKRQGGLVYVPHPFDRMHSVPDYEHLLDVLDGVDAIEVFNPRVAISEFNDEAARFAAKYRIPAGAGSDAHVPQGLGSVRIRMREFNGPEEFLESLRDADIVRNPASLLYVQALKFLQTKALPEAARRASRERRVRRATGRDRRRASGPNRRNS
jgi:predicted metal-dependent phosphoesterase TrpH